MDYALNEARAIARSVSNWARAPLKGDIDVLHLTAATMVVVSVAVFWTQALKHFD